MINESNIQGAAQFLKAVTGLLNENSNGTEEDRTKGTKVFKQPLSAAHAKFAETILTLDCCMMFKIRENILDNLKKLCCRDGVAIEQTADAISSVASAPSQLSLNAQVRNCIIMLL